MKRGTLLLGLAALGLYLFSKRRGAPSPAAATAAPPASLQQCLATRDAATCAKFGFTAAGQLADTIANEMKGIDGMTPDGLGATVASVGGFNGLGGTFYGSI